ncbi:MAG: amino acid permease [Clostridiales bacterium]|nr:amino acid permease [Clostridiales bacterium]
MNNSETQSKSGLSRYINMRSAWALAVGTSVGWGSLVVTCNTYLKNAGPLGSVLGIIIGAIVMLIVCRNYGYLANKYHDAGGVYSYTKNVFGYDRAFLVSWYLSMVYISMFWANATSLPLFARYFFGDTYHFGYLYSIFDYDVYAGEMLLTLAAIVLVTILCVNSKTMTAHVMTVLVIAFVIGIIVCFVVSLFGGINSGVNISPAFAPDNLPFAQVIHITFISPWAFIGFENISHSAEEFKFNIKKLHKILVISVITTTLLYIFVTLLSITAYPPEYGNWFEYIQNLGNEKGLRALPAFYAASRYLGNTGVVILSVSLLSLVLTSLIGNMRALSRLFYSLSKDDILPSLFSKLNKKRIPSRAMLLVSAISLAIPFFGRTTIGWVVDITTIGSTLIYGFVCAAAFKTAKKDNCKKVKITGLIGFVTMVIFGIYLLLPGVFRGNNLKNETYFLLITWSILGFVYFRGIIAKDHARRFGKAIIVWIAMLSLVVLMSVIWTNNIEEATTKSAISGVKDYYEGTAGSEILALDEEDFINQTLENIHKTDLMINFVVIALFIFALFVMLNNHFSMKKWEQKAINERDAAKIAAYKDPLTGVKSKTAYSEAETQIEEMISSGITAPFSVVVCDINGLKFINDTLGHKAGDEYIQKGAKLICELFKHSPVYRTGGDEFVIILSEIDYLNRSAIMKKLHDLSVDNIGKDGVVISGGISDFEPGVSKNYKTVYEKADALMYEEKKLLKGLGAVTRL